LRDDVIQIRAPGWGFYVLRDRAGLYLLDSGFIGGHRLLRQGLRKAGWDRDPIKGIIVTHGHLDHILNVRAIAEETGAWIAAPRLDAAHYEGRYPYRGLARVCGVLESIGRPVLRYRPFSVDTWIDDGTELSIWHGLTAVHLPGHTDGHMGFYCAKLRLLFCADLFASYGAISHLPPAIFNSAPKLIPASVTKALALDLEGVVPHHCDLAPPVEHLRRLQRLAGTSAGTHNRATQ